MSTKCRVEVVASYSGPRWKITSATTLPGGGRKCQGAFSENAANFQDWAVYYDLLNSGHAEGIAAKSDYTSFFKLVEDGPATKGETNATLPETAGPNDHFARVFRDSQTFNLHWSSRTSQALLFTHLTWHINREEPAHITPLDKSRKEKSKSKLMLPITESVCASSITP